MRRKISVLDGRGEIEFLADRFKLECKAEQCFGAPDEYVEKEFPYQSIRDFPTEPSDMINRYEDIQRFPIYIPEADRTIVFFITRTFETVVHPTHDETLYGPYLSEQGGEND